MAVEIRPCRRDEIDAVLALWGLSRSSHAVTPDTPEAIERLLAGAEDGVLVAVLDGELVGSVVAAWDGWRGNFYRLTVAGEHRRRGIGRALVREGEERLRAKGAPRITALVAFDDDRAGAFWESVGYARDPVMGRMVRSL